MCELQKLFDGLFQTFSKNKEQRRDDILNIFNQVRCCDCGHRGRIAVLSKETTVARGGSQSESGSCSKMRTILIGCGVVLAVLPMVVIYMARQHNHSQSHGSGACVSSFFYTFTDCDVIF